MSQLIEADPEVVDIDSMLAESRAAITQATGQMAKALIQAKTVKALREWLTDARVKEIAELADTELGFLTDRPPGTRGKDGQPMKPYPLTVIRDVTIVALMNGFQLVGNQFNVISGRFYPTSEGIATVLSKWPGLTDLKLEPGVPQKIDGRPPVTRGKDGHTIGALVPFRATWKINGVPDAMDCTGDYRIPVRCYANSSVDEILGRAKSKIRRRILERITGSTFDPDEQETLPPVVAAEQPSEAIESQEQEDSAVSKPEPCPDDFRAFLERIGKIDSAAGVKRAAAAFRESFSLADEDDAYISDVTDERVRAIVEE